MSLAHSNSLASEQPMNRPYDQDALHDTLYTPFVSAPKTLDIAKAYSADAMNIINQIVEPPLQYGYFSEKLEPLTLQRMPVIRTTHINGKPAMTIDLYFRHDLYYSPHPAFAKNKQGYLYHHLTNPQLKNIHHIKDFTIQSSRVADAYDTLYQIKRMLVPSNTTPIDDLLTRNLIGVDDFKKAVMIKQKTSSGWLDLRSIPFKGINIINRYHLSIQLKRRYPSFMYWLAMPFFAPMPWEIDRFYHQKGLIKRHISMDTQPIGTGPYQLVINDPNRQMILRKNPKFHDAFFPKPEHNMSKAYTKLIGKRLPFIDQVIYYLEKESIPIWQKFMQGYYDKAGLGSDQYDHVVESQDHGRITLSKHMTSKGIRLNTADELSIFYIGFNMIDPIVGGYDDKKRMLRKAITMAVDYNQYIDLFLNGRGMPATSPIPPALLKNQHSDHHSLSQVKKIALAKLYMAQAGYPNGIDQHTGKPLMLHYDTTGSGGQQKAQFDWLRKQFAKLNIILDIRPTQYNRFQEKVRHGQVQLFSYGWLADFPDPENFLFLFYGPNRTVGSGGVNSSNYTNKQFDHLYAKLEQTFQNKERLDLIKQMQSILVRDNPWIWGFHSRRFVLSHPWIGPYHMSSIVSNGLKYQTIDTKLRATCQSVYNRPKIWPLVILVLILVTASSWAIHRYRRYQQRPSLQRLKIT